MSVNVVWKPLPGSQTLALSCPCDEILLEGTRGPGKTAAQLARFRSRVGRGYGSFWRGIIFDLEYKDLADLIVQSKRFYNAFGDGATFLSSASDLKWKWPTGEELLFRYGKSEDDYWGFHGQEFCLAKDELVPLRRGHTRIQDVKVGDEILTPTGFKRVNRTFYTGVKKIVKASVYTLDGSLHSSQLQSEDHQLLTTEQGYLSQHPHLSHSVPLLLEMSGLTGYADIYHYERHRDDKAFYGEQVCAETYAKEFRSSNQEDHQAHIYFSPSSLLELVDLLLCFSHQRETSKSFRMRREFSLLLQMRKGVRTWGCLYHRQRIKQHLSLLVSQISQTHARLQDAQIELCRLLNLMVSCFFYHGQYGELAHKGIESALSLAQQPHDDAKTNHQSSSLGASEDVFSSTRLDAFLFPHPYQRDRWLESNHELSFGRVEYEAFGEAHCFDIEVDDCNVYYTSSGLINKNCFIGFNELTKQKDDGLYEAMFSCRRSSFRPEEHPLKDGSLLPNIPLETFSTTNPFGIGHAWVKKRFISPAPRGTIQRHTQKVFNPQTKQEEDITLNRVAIHGSYKENPYLDPGYVANLMNIKDPNKRKAWVEGSWDVTSGGRFDHLWDERHHVVKPFKIPSDWRVDRSHDWGESKPFANLWWAESTGSQVEIDGKKVSFPSGSLFLIAEWYGCPKDELNKGLNMPSSEVGRGVAWIDKQLSGKAGNIEPPECLKQGQLHLVKNVCHEVKAGPADNSITNTGDNELSIADKMAKVGCRWKESNKKPGSRINGASLFCDMLNAVLEGKKKESGMPEDPGFYVFDTCRGWLDRVPKLPRDTKNPDDVDTDAEDHDWDATRYRVLASKRKAMGINMKTVN